MSDKELENSELEKLLLSDSNLKEVVKMFLEMSDKESENSESEKLLSFKSNLKERFKELHDESDIHLRDIQTAPINLDIYTRYWIPSEDISELQLDEEYIEYLKTMIKKQTGLDDE